MGNLEVAIVPPSVEAGPTPVTLEIDLGPLVGHQAAPSGDGRFERWVLSATSVDSAAIRGVPLQFEPDGGDPHARSGTLTWLAEPGVTGIRIAAERTTLEVTESVTNLPMVVAAGFQRHQVIPGYGTTVGIEVDGIEVFGYSYDPLIPKPFYYPLIGPAGRHLTRRHHARDLDGKAHEHHRSIWIEHMDVNQVSFETEDLDLLQRFGGGGELVSSVGRIVQTQFLRQTDGPVSACFATDAEWRDDAGEVLLRQVTESRLTELPGRERLIDFDITLTAIADRVTFRQTSFGGLAVRVAGALEPGFGQGRIENDAGAVNEAGCHWQRSRWLDASGPVTAERWNGLAVLDHPGNRDHPTGWHVRDDGWFCAAPSFVSPIDIKQGEEVRLRYRVLLHDGDARAGRVDARQRAYADPPTASVAAWRTADPSEE